MAKVTITIDTRNDAEEPLTWGQLRRMVSHNTPYTDGLEVRLGLSDEISNSYPRGDITVEVDDVYVPERQFAIGTIAVTEAGDASYTRLSNDNDGTWQPVYMGRNGSGYVRTTPLEKWDYWIRRDLASGDIRIVFDPKGN